jgi:bacillolysin
VAEPFKTVRFHATDVPEAATRDVETRGMRGPRDSAVSGEPEVPFQNDEAAARYYLDQALAADAREEVRDLRGPTRPELVPEHRAIGERVSSLMRRETRVVAFEQTSASIPIFGSRVNVEMDSQRRLISLNAAVADVAGVSPIPSVSAADALASIADFAGVDVKALAGVEAPTLVFYFDHEKGDWHLAHFVKNVPVAPAGFKKSVANDKHGHGLGPSPRRDEFVLHYLVDGHDASVLFYYSANPFMLEIPAKCDGRDEDDAVQQFYGLKVGEQFHMRDTLRAIKTYDLNYADLRQAALPGSPVANAAASWNRAGPAAVSAHVNATKVFDFYNGVLKRDGIDDKGMELSSVVNCYYPGQEAKPQWSNAVWSRGRMWYGQAKDAQGKLRSFSRYLDVIAHELTHGVTESTSGLVYKDQSGALNESFSDIFGIIIKNWYAPGGSASVANWDWQLGAGLGQNGLPLRDLKDPTRTGDPDHMKNYLETVDDEGGVHTNSNIHNKAAYNVLIAPGLQGQSYAFTPEELAVLYYICLTRLGSLASFADTLRTLIDVAKTYYTTPAERDLKVRHIEDGYGKVGIKK